MSGAKDDIFYFEDGDDIAPEPIKPSATKKNKTVAAISKNILDEDDDFDYIRKKKVEVQVREQEEEKKKIIHVPGGRRKNAKLPTLSTMRVEDRKEISIPGYEKQQKKPVEDEDEEVLNIREKTPQRYEEPQDNKKQEVEGQKKNHSRKKATRDYEDLEEVQLETSPKKQNVFEKKPEPVVNFGSDHEIDLQSDTDSPKANANEGSDRQQVPLSRDSSPLKAITIGQINNRKEFLSVPILKDRQLQLTIKRDKGGLGLYPQYDVFLSLEYRYMMTAKKRSGNTTSNYLVSSDKNELEPTSPSYMGKIRSNFMGTNFQIYDDGCNPEKKEQSKNKPRKILASVHYASNIFGSKGPRKMQVYIPDPAVNPPTTPEKDIKEHWEKQPEKFIGLMNKPPKWNEAKQIYMLDFKGRVDKPSVKNFILVQKDTQEPYVLLFGRVGEDVFHLDVMYPLSPLQALGIVMTSFDTKLACQ